MKFIEDNITKINFTILSRNTFNPKWCAANEIVDSTMAMRPLNLPPYILQNIFSYTVPSALSLMETMNIIEGIMQPNPTTMRTGQYRGYKDFDN